MTSALRQFYRSLFGLQFRTTLLLTGVVLAATALTGATSLRLFSRLTLAEAKDHARDMAKALAAANAEAVRHGNREGLMTSVEEIVSQGHLSYIIFTDMTGKLLAGYQRGAGTIAHLLLDNADTVSVEPINRPEVATEGGAGSRIDIVYPVTAPSNGSDSAAPPATLGYVRLGLSLRDAEARMAKVVRNVIGLAIGITLLMVPLGYEVVRHVAAPLNRLAEAARDFAAGKLETRVGIRRRDEIGELSDAFNSMANELAISHNQLVKLNAELEDRVLQRTTALEEANRQLREMAVRDSLTGLYNRHHFNEISAQLFAEATRYNTDITCMMVDLDDLKQVNDSFGHRTGDRMLQLTAGVVKRVIRESDVAVRYGGDEFVVLLPRTSPSEAGALAERMQQAFHEEVDRVLPHASIATLSIGLASREQDWPASADDLVNLADEALYLAKSSGKNRIMVACAADHRRREA